ncbi:ABC transporter permease [Candidatus Bipolaricaulota bacterium]|nr:ABC transporter permease [Candidatus Bipolaricaulota bacterium]
MKAFWGLIAAETKELLRDRAGLFWMLGFPVIFILLFGFVFSGSEEVHFELGVVGGSDPASQGLLEALKRVPVLTVHQGAQEEELAELRAGRRDGVLVIPAGLSERPDEGGTEFVLYVDATQLTGREVLSSVLDQVLAEFEARAGGPQRRLVLTEKPIQARNFRPIDFTVPGVLAMTIMQLGLFGVAAHLLSLRERKVLRRLWAAPVPRTVFVSAQITQRVLLALLQGAIILTLGHVVFSVPILGSRAVLLGVLILGALTFVALGYFLAALARTQESGIAFLQAVNFPMMFLSGIFWPVEWMPGFLRPVVWALPLTYLGDALRQTMVQATPLVPLWLDLVVLGGWLAVLAILAVRFFRWE